MITVVYNDPKQIESIRDMDNCQFIDILTKKGKKEGWAVKSHWGAKLDPFILIEDNGKVTKAFYSEAGDAISEFLNYIENENVSIG